MNDGVEVDNLEGSVNEALDDLLESGDLTDGNPRREFAREVEEDEGLDKLEKNWSSEELKYLLNNRESMSNDDLKEFFERDKEFQREDFGQFSSSEEKFILQNYSSMSVEDIADRMDRSPRAVEMQLRIMGLGEKVDR